MYSFVIACYPCAIKCLPSLERAIGGLGAIQKVQGSIWHIDTNYSASAVKELVGAHIESKNYCQIIDVSFLDADAVIQYLSTP